MELRCSIFCLTFFVATGLVYSLPASLVDELKTGELRENKVKRAHPELSSPEERRDNVPYYSKPTAIKRGTNLKTLPTDQQVLTEWEKEQAPFQGQDELQSGLFASGDNPFEDKTLAEYDKGYRYGTNKDKLNEALENAVLKSELYGDPVSMNQYRYYGADDRLRRRREAKKLRLENRIKRETELTPEEVLAILSLYENERQKNAGYRSPWQRLEQQNYESVIDKDTNELDQQDEDWMDTPIYPHASRANDLYYDEAPGVPQMYEKRGRWGGYADRAKRFMVAKKRNDPTRELRYLNGPNKNDFYTLSQLVNNEREPTNVPLYHRLVL